MAAVEIKGLEPLLATFGKLENLIGQLEQPTSQILDLIQERIKEYPPPPPNSTYIRTYNLQNSWQKQLMLSGNVLGKVESGGPDYNVYVQDRERQAAVHQGRWQTRQDVAEDTEQEAVQIIDAFVQELLKP